MCHSKAKTNSIVQTYIFQCFYRCSKQCVAIMLDMVAVVDVVITQMTSLAIYELDMVVVVGASKKQLQMSIPIGYQMVDL